MRVEQIYIDNPARNFNYLITCEQTGDCLAIDPLDAKQCLQVAHDKGWNITQILNTHEHWDHIGGNDKLQQATQAKLLAHAGAKESIPNIDIGLSAGDVVKVGKTVTLQVLDTPGHTLTHICLLSQTDTPALFSGDTLFNAGCGNCIHGGHPEALYETFMSQFKPLSDHTLLYPGHDYMVNNLNFSLHCEANNKSTQATLAEVKNQDPHHAKVTTLKLERQMNPFFRLDNPEIIQFLRSQFSDLSENPTPKEVFLCLRELRNQW